MRWQCQRSPVLSARITTSESTSDFSANVIGAGYCSSASQVMLGKMTIAITKAINALAHRAIQESDCLFRLYAGADIDIAAIEMLSNPMLTEAS